MFAVPSTLRQPEHVFSPATLLLCTYIHTYILTLTCSIYNACFRLKGQLPRHPPPFSQLQWKQRASMPKDARVQMDDSRAYRLHAWTGATSIDALLMLAISARACAGCRLQV